MSQWLLFGTNCGLSENLPALVPIVFHFKISMEKVENASLCNLHISEVCNNQQIELTESFLLMHGHLNVGING